RADPAAAVARRTAPIQIAPPPDRTRRDWVMWFLKMVPQMFRFEEMDLFLWVGVGLLVGRLDWLVWLLFASQVTVMLSMIVRRSREMLRADRQLRALGDQ
ncbi:MAG TPA: hypothetical protein VKZ63_11665, partial [Kofleriaceae bacterium]|nr:hypothetical protein [Kofleriaceae bacterium]